jgi:hypothetical protein
MFNATGIHIFRQVPPVQLWIVGNNNTVISPVKVFGVIPKGPVNGKSWKQEYGYVSR